MSQSFAHAAPANGSECPFVNALEQIVYRCWHGGEIGFKERLKAELQKHFGSDVIEGEKFSSVQKKWILMQNQHILLVLSDLARSLHSHADDRKSAPVAAKKQTTLRTNGSAARKV